MEIQTTFCHNQDESARDLSPPPSCQNPLDWLSGQLDDLTAQAGFDDADWGLIEKYLLMPLFDIATAFVPKSTRFVNWPFQPKREIGSIG